jgi:hypothetical protein
MDTLSVHNKTQILDLVMDTLSVHNKTQILDLVMDTLSVHNKTQILCLCSTKMCLVITRHILVGQLGSQGKGSRQCCSAIRTHC